MRFRLWMVSHLMAIGTFALVYLCHPHFPSPLIAKDGLAHSTPTYTRSTTNCGLGFGRLLIDLDMSTGDCFDGQIVVPIADYRVPRHPIECSYYRQCKGAHTGPSS